MRPPYWLTMDKCVITPTPTGTNNKDKCDSRKSAQAATGSRTSGQRSASKSSNMPITGPGNGSDSPRDSSSPSDCNSSKKARPRRAFMGRCDAP